MTYDSTQDTLDHIKVVRGFLNIVIRDLSERARLHDLSKLESPEKEAFDIATPKLRSLTYGSDEYKESLKELGVALKHHYENNDHHAEFFEDGIKGMSLISLVEMICDWLAATKRHADGDIYRSIEQNQQRFGYSDELKQIFINTVREIENGKVY